MADYSNADFIERMERHKKLRRISDIPDISILDSKTYNYASKDKQLVMRDEVYNKKLTRWLK